MSIKLIRWREQGKSAHGKWSACKLSAKYINHYHDVICMKNLNTYACICPHVYLYMFLNTENICRNHHNKLLIVIISEEENVGRIGKGKFILLFNELFIFYKIYIFQFL